MGEDGAVAADEHGVRDSDNAIGFGALVFGIAYLRPREFECFDSLNPRLFTLVNRYTDDGEAVAVFREQLFETGHRATARTAPTCPEVHDKEVGFANEVAECNLATVLR